MYKVWVNSSVTTEQETSLSAEVRFMGRREYDEEEKKIACVCNNRGMLVAGAAGEMR